METETTMLTEIKQEMNMSFQDDYDDDDDVSSSNVSSWSLTPCSVVLDRLSQSSIDRTTTLWKKRSLPKKKMKKTVKSFEKKNKKPLLSCHSCNFVAKTKIQLKTHIAKKKHCGRQGKAFGCDSCAFQTDLIDEIRIHVESGHADNMANFPCEHCEFVSETKSVLLKHIGAEHYKMKAFSCDQCDFTSLHRGNVQTHILTVHEKVRNYPCEFCDYRAGSKGVLNSHVRAHHLNMKPFSCDLCQFATTQRGNLKAHVISVHAKVRNFACELCDYRATTKGILVTHVRNKHEKKKKDKTEKKKKAEKSGDGGDSVLGV